MHYYFYKNAVYLSNTTEAVIYAENEVISFFLLTILVLRTEYILVEFFPMSICSLFRYLHRMISILKIILQIIEAMGGKTVIWEYSMENGHLDV